MIRTLVVEDDPIAQQAHVSYVGRVPGYGVVGAAGTGAEALRVLATKPVDLVLLDVHLPDTHGVELLRRMRAAGHRTDVIMVTRARDLDVVQAAVAFGATQYLMKPFTFNALRAKLDGHRAYVERLARTDVRGVMVAQRDVDAILGTLRAPAPDPGLPKSVSRESLDAVIGALRAAALGAPGTDHGLTAAEVAETLGTSRVTARRYLEYLVETGLGERRARYGGSGRPQLEYSWRARGAES